MISPQPSPRIVVVGPCASGKTSLADGLRRHGYEVVVSGQEHSDIPHLWQRTGPDVVIALAVDLASIRRRRHNDRWPAWLLARQRDRLRQAVAGATMRIDTSDRDPPAVLRLALSRLGRLPREA
ncbi:MAG: hypothetical protein M3464_17655 [Chloroflexota bacterium]|nr:hypothetical protein [Chloroflexota bacterium]